MASVSEQVPNADDVVRELPGYRIERELGRGSMGVVYLAEDVHLERKVALKVLTPFLAHDERFRSRFTRESRVAANLDHAHIIPIYGAGEAGGLLYIAMRYVEGRDLRALLEADAPLALERAFTLLTQVADALDAAHEEGLVHRDVKPANILVDRRKGREHCYLCDFGITKHTASGGDLTATGQMFGTLDYVSPEQIKGKTVDGRADVYALGCMLYQCLTGVVAFQREESAALLWAHMHEEPQPVTALRPDLPPAVDCIVAKAMAKQPEDRYTTCGELALALGTATATAPAARNGSEAVVQPETTAVHSPTCSSSHSETHAFAPLGVPLQRRGSVLAPPPRPRRRWPLAVGAASSLTLILVGILLFLVGVDTPRARLPDEEVTALPDTEAAAFPTEEEKALISQAPIAFVQGCKRSDVTEEGAVASVRCGSEQGAHEIVLTQLTSQSARQDAYNRRLSDAGISPDTGGDCRDRSQAEHQYEGGRGTVGRVLCYRNNLSSVLVWTDDNKPVTLMSATRPDADYAQLHKWWDGLVERRSLPTPAASPPLRATSPIPAAPTPTTKPRETPKPRPPASPAPKEGLAYVPASFRSTCSRSGGLASPSAATASVECTPTSGADRIGYFQFQDRGRLKLFYLQQIRRSWSTSGIRAERYDHGNGNAGHVLLFTNGEGKPRIEWTNERLVIYSVAVGSDADALVKSWKASDFGPR
ncbi:MAG: protein kinase domain-containing protein [Egibacteraceae bacterium]